jgi:HSP20 family protein
MLSVWDPFADLNRIQREFERSFFAPRVASKYGNADFAPQVDVYEEKEALVITAELPGLKREEVDISLDGDILTLRGERKLEKYFENNGKEKENESARKESEGGRKFHRVERSYGTFVRSFQLPTNVDAEKAQAQLTDGVLTLRLPKKDVVKGRKIEVRNA